MVYIPEKHRKYDLLPLCQKIGGEVFSYPGKQMEEIHQLIKIGESIIPYGYDSYQDYQSILDEFIQRYESESNKECGLVKKLEILKKEINLMNVKEDWSVVQYLGENTSSFTKGQCYYWPCYREAPAYEGIIDDEEFTSYLHDIDINEWRIMEDPLGVAEAVLDLSCKF